jgi:hypothetical protein
VNAGICSGFTRWISFTGNSSANPATYWSKMFNNMGLYRFRRGIDWREKRAGVPAPENAENNLFAKPNYALAA